MEQIILNNDQKDALQEVANIGAAHAATALSMMVGINIDMGIPEVEIVPVENSIDRVKDQENVAGVFLRIEEGIPLNILMLLSKDSAFSLSNILMGEESNKPKDILSEMDESAIKEVGNVMMTSFFDSITEFLGVSLIPGPPSFTYNNPAAVMEYVLSKIGDVTKEAVVFNCDVMKEGSEDFSIDLFLLPSPSSVKLILEKLGMVT